VAGVAGRMQQRAGQGRLAGAQVAMQVDRQARRQRARQRRAQGQGAGFILQFCFEMLHLLKWLTQRKQD
jgi:hypothetical protein